MSWVARFAARNSQILAVIGVAIALAALVILAAVVYAGYIRWAGQAVHSIGGRQ